MTGHGESEPELVDIRDCSVDGKELEVGLHVPDAVSSARLTPLEASVLSFVWLLARIGQKRRWIVIGCVGFSRLFVLLSFEPRDDALVPLLVLNRISGGTAGPLLRSFAAAVHRCAVFEDNSEPLISALRTNGRALSEEEASSFATSASHPTCRGRNFAFDGGGGERFPNYSQRVVLPHQTIHTSFSFPFFFFFFIITTTSSSSLPSMYLLLLDVIPQVYCFYTRRDVTKEEAPRRGGLLLFELLSSIPSFLSKKMLLGWITCRQRVVVERSLLLLLLYLRRGADVVQGP